LSNEKSIISHGRKMQLNKIAGVVISHSGEELDGKIGERRK
jgi:hypothetical protein